MGGINVARRIFKQITPLYEPSQERYHLVRHTSSTGGGSPTIPFGYLLLLSVKRCASTGPIKDTDQNWAELIRLATDYAAVLDVQSYTPSIWQSMDAVALLPYLQETALYDTLFCLPQIRGSDVEKIARGILRDYDFDKEHGSGWSLNDALAVIAVLLEKSLPQRGPVRFDVRGIAAACPTVPRNIVQNVIDEALCHPHPGANQRFSKPTDSPQSLDPSERDAYDAAIWTALASNFHEPGKGGEPFSVTAAIRYLETLERWDAAKFAPALAYIRNAPIEVQTPVRAAVQRRWPRSGRAGRESGSSPAAYSSRWRNLWTL